MNKMGMVYFNYMTEIYKSSLKKFPEITRKTKSKLLKELQMELLRNGLFRFDIGSAMFFYLAYISAGDIDGKVKIPLAKRALMQPDYDINIEKLNDEQVKTILWTSVSFLKRMGYYQDFERVISEWNNSLLGKDNPLLPWNRGQETGATKLWREQM